MVLWVSIEYMYLYILFGIQILLLNMQQFLYYLGTKVLNFYDNSLTLSKMWLWSGLFNTHKLLKEKAEPKHIYFSSSFTFSFLFSKVQCGILYSMNVESLYVHYCTHELVVVILYYPTKCEFIRHIHRLSHCILCYCFFCNYCRF